MSFGPVQRAFADNNVKTELFRPLEAEPFPEHAVPRCVCYLEAGLWPNASSVAVRHALWIVFVGILRTHDSVVSMEYLAR